MRLFPTLLFLFLTVTVFGQTDTREVRQSLYFASASDQLDAAATAELTTFAQNLLAYADYRLSVAAYTDEQGTDTYNASLARRRAVTVETALAKLLVRSTATEVIAYGESQARQATTDDTERRQDRRVDLVATVTLWESAAQAIATARQEQQQQITLANPGQRQSIQGKNGGVFLVEANSLVRPDGSPAVGPVTVELIETYDMAEMIIAGLTTTEGDR
ncbi:MAG: OmpA family protein, partial [Bacteroidota bacterium]